jgi:hypothetical protein
LVKAILNLNNVLDKCLFFLSDCFLYWKWCRKTVGRLEGTELLAMLFGVEGGGGRAFEVIRMI